VTWGLGFIRGDRYNTDLLDIDASANDVRDQLNQNFYGSRVGTSVEVVAVIEDVGVAGIDRVITTTYSVTVI